MASYLFEVYEPRGRLVRLSRLVWEEKILTSSPRGHPEVASYLETVQATIVALSVIFQSIRRADAEVCYRFNAGRDRYANCHLAVIVKYVAEADERFYGYISTVYLTRRIAQGVVVWVPPLSLPSL